MAKQKPRRGKRKRKEATVLAYDHLMFKDKSKKSNQKKSNRDQEAKRPVKVKIDSKSSKAGSKDRFCDICKVCVMGLIKLHLTRAHFKEDLMKKYRREIKERKCSLCDQDFSSKGPAALLDHIGSFHDKVYEFYSEI